MDFLDDLLSFVTDLLTLSPKAVFFYCIALLILLLVIALCFC